MNELENLLKQQMEWRQLSTSCASCTYYDCGSGDERGPGPGCTLNGAIRLSTTSGACCKHWTSKKVK